VSAIDCNSSALPVGDAVHDFYDNMAAKRVQKFDNVLFSFTHDQEIGLGCGQIELGHGRDVLASKDHCQAG